MKIYIRDKRANPRVIYIDGKKYYFGGNKEFLNDFPSTAVKLLEQKEFLEIRSAEEPDVKEPEKKQEAPKPVEKNVEEVKEPEPVKEPELVKEPEIEPEPASNEVVEEPKPDNESVIVEASDESNGDVVEAPADEVVEESEPVEEKEEKPDYASMTKRVLREIMEEKGAYIQGMSKGAMVEWLEANA